MELLNLFPPDDPETSDTIIREARWPDGDDFFVIWFADSDGEWIAVDATVMDPHARC